MPYYSRVLTRQEEYPSCEDLAQLLQADHPDFSLSIEEGTEEEWEVLLLASVDGVEIALIERNPVFEGSLGQDEIAEFIEDIQDCKPESAVEWLEEFMLSVRMIYAFQHLQGADLVEGGNALHALRAALWERGEAIIQADDEGFTNEDGYHILWQFTDAVSGPWNMGVLQDETWFHFTMDLGDPEHREAFLNGLIPADVTAIQAS